MQNVFSYSVREREKLRWERASRAELNVENGKEEVGKSHCNYQKKKDKKQYYLRLQNSTIVGCFNNWTDEEKRTQTEHKLTKTKQTHGDKDSRASAREKKYVYKVELSKNEKMKVLSSTRLANYFSKPSSNLFSPAAEVLRKGARNKRFCLRLFVISIIFLLHTLIYNQTWIPPSAIVTFLILKRDKAWWNLGGSEGL